MSEISLKVNELAKRFYIGSSSPKKLISKSFPFLSIPSSISKSDKTNQTIIWALKDVSFELRQGEVLSVIGNNGAGKSTLLKIIAHVMQPTKGSVESYGKVSALLGVGTGFHQDLTGRENIFFNAAILGMKKIDVKRKLEEIVFFSGLKKFLDTPIKYYSNGMKIRLGFSIAAHLEPKILLLDEVLMVGDESFKKRSIAKIKEIAQEQGCSILFASHNMGAVSEVCRKGIYMEAGQIKHIGEINELVENYKGKAYKEVEAIKLEETIKQGSKASTSSVKESFAFIVDDQTGKGKYDFPYRQWSKENSPSTEHIRLLNITASKAIDNSEAPILLGDSIEFSIRFEKRLNKGFVEPAVQLVSGLGEIFLVSSAAFKENKPTEMPAGIYTAKCKVPKNLLNSGRFYVDLLFHEDRKKRAIFRMNRVLLFQVIPPEQEFGVNYRRTTGPIRPLLEWTVEDGEQL